METRTTKRKPPNVIYTVDEVPPRLVTLFNGVQHVGLISIFLVYPLLVFRVAEVPLPLVANLLAVGLVVLGVGTLLQSLRGPVGSGFMCPSTFTAVYLGPSLLAVKAGGLPVLFGMTVFAGALEMALSKLLDRMRPIFPPELSGLIIFMVGWGAGIAGLRTLLGADATPLRTEEFWVSALTLFTMVALNVWGTGMLRMLCALFGLLIGYAAAAALDLLEGKQFAVVTDAPWIGLPSLTHVSWSFDAALALPFAIGCVAVAMKAVGTITICQRMNDADWVRPDMESARRGVLADGMATVIAGGMGALGTNTSTPSVGLASATGVGSRQVAYAVAILFIVLGLTPKLTATLAVMPRSVMIAALLFAVSFIIINGLQVMTSRLLDARRTLVIGLSIVAGGAVEVFPQLAASAPRPLRVADRIVACVLHADRASSEPPFPHRHQEDRDALDRSRRDRSGESREILQGERRDMGRPSRSGHACHLWRHPVARWGATELLAQRPDRGDRQFRRIQSRRARVL